MVQVLQVDAKLRTISYNLRHYFFILKSYGYG